MKKNRCKTVSLTLKKRTGSFLKHSIFEVRHIYSNGKKSKKYNYEVVSRKGNDSVVVIIYCFENGEILIGLKNQLRIAKAVRSSSKKKIEIPLKKCLLLEAIAGSLEDNEKSFSKITKRVKTEIFEEAGYDVRQKDIVSLGPPFYTSLGQSTEKIYPFALKIEKKEKKKFYGDGSLIEKESGEINFFPVKKVLQLIQRGKIQDAKTEIAVLRLLLKLHLL